MRDLTKKEIEETEFSLKEIRKRGIKKTTDSIEKVAKEFEVDLE